MVQKVISIFQKNIKKILNYNFVKENMFAKN